MSRIYIIEKKKESPTTRLIEAGNSAQALRYVTKDVYNVRLATAKEAATLAGDGVQVEDATKGD